jgi:hypothetical protein
LLQTGSNTTMLTRHHYHHFPTYHYIEHLNLSPTAYLVLHSLVLQAIEVLELE